MTLPITSKKSVAAAVAAFALSSTLVACGAENDTATSGGGLSTAATAPGAATVAEGTSVNGEPAEEGSDSGDSSGAKPTTNGADKKNGNDTQQNRGNGANAEEDVAVPTLINPLEDGLEAPTYEPLANGREGTDAERREMEEVVNKITNPESFAKWTRVILDNSCAEVRDPALEEFERQGLTLDMVEQIMAQQEAQGGSFDIPKSQISVSDVRVDGDRASATVHSKSSAGENESVQLFAKEDGKWKVCKN